MLQARSSSSRLASRLFVVAQKRHASYTVPVFLTESVPKLGSAGQIVQVQPGHARNYLVRYNKAIYVGEGIYRKVLPVTKVEGQNEQVRLTAASIASEITTLLQYQPMSVLEHFAVASSSSSSSSSSNSTSSVPSTALPEVAAATSPKRQPTKHLLE